MPDAKQVVDRIAQAFKSAKQPRSEKELTVGGIDGPSVVKHFLGRTQEDIEKREFIGHLHMEDFSYMTPMAVEYYLPAVLRYMLRETDDDSAWIYVHGYLQPRHSEEFWWNIKELTSRQRRAIAQWAEYLHGLWTASPQQYIDPAEAEKLATAYK